MGSKTSKYDIFISYRRDGGEETAKHLRDTLTERGYKVFLDVEALRSGPFNKALYDVIDNAKDFVLILPENGLDRCRDENDWVRLEIERAKEGNKNIIPVMLKGFEFPEELPESIDFVRFQNAPPRFEITFFDAFVDKLETFFVSKRKPIWKKIVVIAAALAVVAAAVLGIVYFSKTYPLTTKDKNKVSDLIAYLTLNYQQADLAGEKYVKELDRALEYVEGKTTDSEATLKLELVDACEQLTQYRASLTDVSSQLREDLKDDRHFVLGDIDRCKPYLYSVITGYIDGLTYLKDNVISENALRSETHVAYIRMLRSTAELDAELLFYDLNNILLSVTNESALAELKNKMLPEMSFIYAKRLDLIHDKEALVGKKEAVFSQYDKCIAQYEESLTREENDVDAEGTLKSYDYMIEYLESRGMDATELKKQREEFKEKADRLEEEKASLAEDKQELADLKDEAYEKFKPSKDDDPGTLWGKGKRFLTIKMPEAAAECFRMFIDKAADEDKPIGEAGLLFTQNCESLGMWGGVVVSAYEDGLPRQAVEIGDVIYEADGSPVVCENDYFDAVAADGVHQIKLVRFTDDGYELLESVIDKSLGRIAISALNDNP